MASNQSTTGTVVGYFDNKSDAQKAVHALQDAGFTSAHVGMASRGEPGESFGDRAKNTAQNAENKTEGMWDRVKNFFDGGDTEQYSDERAEGALANREVTPNPDVNYDAYGQSDLRGNLTGMSVPEDRSRYFEHRFHSGSDGAVVTVNAGSRYDEVASIISDNGGDLGDNADTYDYNNTDYNNTDYNNTTNNLAGVGGAAAVGGASALQGTQNIQLLGEILRVHKERVSRGEVNIRKEVITENQTIQVPVSREELVIERRAVNGDTAANGTIGEGQAIRIPLSEETASVDKSTVVREEVSVGKRNIENTRDLSGDVRHEELVVDDNTTKSGNR